MATIQEEFSVLTKKRDDLQHRANLINLRIEEAKKKHAALVEIAKEKFGVDNVDDLRKKVILMKEENEKTVATFKSELEKVETDVIKAESILNGGAGA